MFRALCAAPVLPWERRWLVCSCPGQRLGSCSWPFVFSLLPWPFWGPRQWYVGLPLVAQQGQGQKTYRGARLGHRANLRSTQDRWQQV